MNKRIICIECPQGCEINIKEENGKREIEGNECPKGKEYAYSEIKCPMRILTTTVLTQGLKNKTVPVKTDKPVPKSKMMDIISEIHKLRVKKPVSVGDIIAGDLLGTGVKLMATREVD